MSDRKVVPIIEGLIGRDPLGVDCPNCGHPARVLSMCPKCDEFIGVTLALTDTKTK